MIAHSTCGSRVCTFMIARLVFTITNNLKQIMLSTTASLYGSRVYIGVYIPNCIISDNNCFYYNNNLKQIVSSYAYYLILKLSITASLYGSKVYFDICIYDCSHNIPFYHIAIL